METACVKVHIYLLERIISERVSCSRRSRRGPSRSTHDLVREVSTIKHNRTMRYCNDDMNTRVHIMLYVYDAR